MPNPTNLVVRGVPALPRGTAQNLADVLLARARSGRGFEAASLAAQLSNLARTHPRQEAAIRQAVEARLTPVQRGQLAAAETAMRRLNPATVALDLGQVALDIIGIFEPTPFADLTNAGISVLRGDFKGAGISAAGALPYLGDLAKAGKLGRWAQTVSNAVSLALSNSRVAQQLSPHLARVAQVIDRIPTSVLERLPRDVRAKLSGIRSQIAAISTPVGRLVERGVQSAAQRLGVDPSILRAVASAPPGRRPSVSTYMTAAQQTAHLAQFGEGIVRITRQSDLARWGTLGPPGGYVTSLRDFRAVMAEARGDLRVVERRLGLMEGQLSSRDTLIALIRPSDAPSLRIPDGNAGGANPKWIPGGYTSGNTIEAVMDFPRGLPYTPINLTVR